MENMAKNNEKPICEFCKLPIMEDHIVTKVVGCDLPKVEIKQVPVPDTRYARKIAHPSEGSLVLFRDTPNGKDMLAYDLGELTDEAMDEIFQREHPFHRRCYDVLHARNFTRRIEKFQRRFTSDLKEELQKQQ